MMPAGMVKTTGMPVIGGNASDVEASLRIGRVQLVRLCGECLRTRPDLAPDAGYGLPGQRP